MGLLPKSKKIGPVRFTRRKRGIGVSLDAPKLGARRRPASREQAAPDQPPAPREPSGCLRMLGIVSALIVGAIVTTCVASLVWSRMQ